MLRHHSLGVSVLVALMAAGRAAPAPRLNEGASALAGAGQGGPFHVPRAPGTLHQCAADRSAQDDDPVGTRRPLFAP
jgi:hypothetical protein